jgi:hypothetical protein
MCALCGATLIRAKRIFLPVRNLQFWIEQNILLFLKDAPFDKRDAHLVAIAGSCVDCPSGQGNGATTKLRLVVPKRIAYLRVAPVAHQLKTFLLQR